MKRSALIGSVAACICVGLSVPGLAADPATGTANSPASGNADTSTYKSAETATAKPAESCLSDLRTFDDQMEKDGYWLGGSGYGYGYPMAGYGFTGYGFTDHPTIEKPTATSGTRYQNARPGYELRTLIAAANILARQGQQQPCEDVLAATREIYKDYVADMQSGKVPVAAAQGWQQQQIAAAQPVASKNIAFRSDELIGTAVRNPQNKALGSVEDLVMSPQTGDIAYLVIARGGIFGIGQTYVPVPWDDFKISPNVKLLVLDTTTAVLDAAPHVKNDQFATSGNFDKQSQNVDSYWKAHLATKSNG